MFLPPSLGQVTYKTSLLHLQPRQMSLVMTELRDDIFLSSCDAVYSNYHEDDEEDFSIVVGGEYGGGEHYFTGGHCGGTVSPPNRCFLQPRSPPNSPRLGPSRLCQAQTEEFSVELTQETEISQLRY